MKLTIAEGFVLCLCLQVQGYVGQTFRFRCSSYIFHEASDTVSYNWEESKILCENNGSKLVSMENLEAELNFLENETTQALKTQFEYYIGLRKDNGTWRWISNNSTIEAPRSRGRYPWALGQPNGNGNCVKIFFSWWKELVYDDIDCNTRQRNIGYICERQLEECNDKNGPIARLSTTEALPVSSVATQSTSSTQQKSTKDVSTVLTEAGIKTVARTAELRGHKDHDKRYFTEFIVAASLAAFLFIMLIAFAALAVLFFLKRKKRRQDARASISVGNPPEDHNGPLLNPENDATQLGLSETEDGIGSNERENPQGATPSNLECEYTMLNPLTMTQGDTFYMSLAEGKQGISASGEGDESPTHISQPNAKA